MTDVEAFLKRNIEGYLFYDLRAMQQDDANGEGVGYPLVMSTCAGIEILGALLSASAFNNRPGTGSGYFNAFWRDYLYPPPSVNGAVGDTLYQLVRHGIAHGYVLKGNIGVLRKRPELHLATDASGLLYIDAVELSNNLMAAYRTRVVPILAKTVGPVSRASMQDRLTEMEATYLAQAAKNQIFSLPASLTPPAATTAISQSAVPSVTSAPPSGQNQSGQSSSGSSPGNTV